MRLLIDTHVFLWYISADPKLPAPFLSAIREPTNEVYLSVASIWEAVIKYGLGNSRCPPRWPSICHSNATFMESPAYRSTRAQCPILPTGRKSSAGQPEEHRPRGRRSCAAGNILV
jgi:hypothetical protein